MNSMNKTELGEYLASNNIASDWGGILAFRTDAINKVLEGAYQAMTSELNIMSPISGTADYSGFGLDDARFTLYTGCPTVSFKNARLSDATATIIFPISYGSYDYQKKTDITSAYLAESRTIEEEDGYVIEFDVTFKTTSNTQKKNGDVVVDIAEASVCRCNLATTELGRKTLGDSILASVKSFDKKKTVIKIATLDYSVYDATAPKSTRVVTQKSPDISADNPDEGSLIILMQLVANKYQGGIPTEPFPYLVPNNKRNGAYLYDASYYLSESCYKYFSMTDNLGFTKCYTLAGDNSISADETATTESTRKNNILFSSGNVIQTEDALTIKYSKLNYAPGENHQFSAWQGDIPLSTAEWELHNLSDLSATGTIASNGMFTAPVREKMTTPISQYVLTAITTDTSTGKTKKSAVIYRVKNYDSAVSPQFATAFRGAGQLTFTLNTKENGPFTWALSEENKGVLIANGKTVIYTPPSTKVSLSRLTLSASSGSKLIASATILLQDQSSDLEIEPAYLNNTFTDQTTQFFLPDEEISRLFNVAQKKAGRTIRAEEVKYTWSLLGPGSISEDGVYTPAADGGATAAVVRLKVTAPHINFEGTSVARITPYAAPKKWSDLATFDIKPLFSEAIAYANGYQQIPIQIEITTKIVGEEYYPISAVELRTLELLYEGGNNVQLPFIDPDLDGIDSQFGSTWGAHTRENRYRYNNNSTKALQPLASTPGTASRRFYIHTTGTVPETFYARFKGDNGFFYNSTDEDFNNGGFNTIKLTPLITTHPESKDYSFTAKRVLGGGAAGSDNGEGGKFEHDDFDFHLQTSDYWRLKYTPQSGWVKFMTLEFDENTSITQWESTQLAETMFSSTGYFFLPADRSTKLPDNAISYDYRLLDVIAETNEHIQQKLDSGEPEVPGELLIILDRFDAVNYVHQHPLSKGMIVHLRDEYGNMHNISINFSAKDNRNQLTFTTGV